MERTFRHLFTPQQSNNHRPRILHVEGIAILSFFVILSGSMVGFLSRTTGPMPAVLGFSSSITASQVVAQTNQERAQAGLPSLTANAQLNSAALAKGNHMCAEQYWAHISPTGTTPWVFMKNSGYKYSVAGENLARDFSDTGTMVSAWMASPTHKANITNGKYKEIGVAVIDCKLLGHDTALVVQMFGSQTVSAPVAQAPARVQATASPIPVAIPQDVLNPVPIDLPTEGQQVAGDESVPSLIANADPTLTLSTPVPVSSVSPIFSPLQVMKAILISVLCTLLFVLCVDMWIAHDQKIIRISGKNLAHIIFLSGILAIVIFIRAGVTL